LEFPEWDVSLSDVSWRALRVAKTNAENLIRHPELVSGSLNIAITNRIKFIRSDLLKNLPKYITYDIIVANLPYVNREWETSPELAFEPQKALFAKDGGLAVVKELIKTAPGHLGPEGLLILELDPCQHKEIIGFAKRYGLKKVLIKGYVVVFRV
jgi:release factor glutamine methyltransferase